ncbi:MAG: hypothetical protein ACK5DV_06185 [Planctomycetota bacterium]
MIARFSPLGRLSIPHPSVIITVAVVIPLLMLACSPMLAQIRIAPNPFPQPGIPRDTSGEPLVELPRDPDIKRRLEAVLDYIKSKDWAQATLILQTLIDAREDVFIRVTPDLEKLLAEAIPGLRFPGRDVSIRALANRVLSRMPKEAIELYQSVQDPKAKGLLKEARENGNLTLLAQIMRSYLHTPSGREASITLGTYYLDRGNDLAASLCFDRVLQADPDDTGGLNPPTLLKAALAMRRAGDTSGEQLAWQRLSRRGIQKIALGGGESRSPEDWKATVAKASPIREFGVQDWTVVGGDSRRSAQAMGGTPFLEPRWPAESTLMERRFVPIQHRESITLPSDRTLDTAKYFADSESYLAKDRLQALIPASQPLAVTVGADNNRVPMVIYRSHGGILARHLKTGAVLWANPLDWTIDRMGLGVLLNKANQKRAIDEWLTQFIGNRLNTDILFENTSIGSISSDATRVFTVVDFEIPPPPNSNGNMFDGNSNPYSRFGTDISDALLHNRTEAYHLTSGKLLWSAGGRSEAAGELADSHFLGPPLPVGDKLYQLNEKQQELRLVILDPSTGALLGLQRLCTTRNRLQTDVSRRMQAAHLSYADGILVCPTNAGVIIGIELLGNSFAWAYPYMGTTEAPEGVTIQPGIPPGMIAPLPGRIIRPGMNGMPMVAQQGMRARWKVTPPIISGGKIIFAAPDADAIHCISLRDGSVIWTHKRTDDDLYLGGVVAGRALIVGKKNVRALEVDGSGKVAWTVATGTPSGMGAISDNQFFVPLRDSGPGRDPEVCVIDVVKGEAVAHTRSRKKAMPGNLIFHDGEMISQTSTSVAVYPQLSVKLAQIDDLIRKNPLDPIGLTERGDLRLDKGDWAGAVNDLVTALKHNPPAEMLPRTREKLFEAMCEYSRRDFNAAEAYLAEFNSTCEVAPPAMATGTQVEEAKRETRRRRSAYLCQLAMGRESQKRWAEAFDAYIDVATLLGGGELYAVLDDPMVRAAGDTWAQGRIASMLAKISATERAPLDTRVTARLERARTAASTLDEIRALVSVFGQMSSSGQETRLVLADRLFKDGSADAMMQAEQQLEQVRPPLASPDQHARALIRLANLHLARQLPDDAAACILRLAAEHPDLNVEGKTGKARLAEATTDHRLLPFLDGPGSSFPPGKIRVTDKPGGNRTPIALNLASSGPTLPFFQRHFIQLQNTQNTGFQTIRMVERATGEERMSEPLIRRNMLHTSLSNGGYKSQIPTPRFTYQSIGHVLLVGAGNIVYAVDPLRKRILWDLNLAHPAEPASSSTQQQGNLVMDGNALQIVFADGYKQRPGQAGPLLGNAAILMTRDGLMAIDPLTGRTLWVRQDVGLDTTILTDGLTLALVSMDPTNGKPVGTRGVRAIDGSPVAVPDCSTALSRKLRVEGGNILWLDDAAEKRKLRYTEALSMRDIWSLDLSADALVIQTDDLPFAGTVEPDGTTKIFELATARELMVARLDPRHVKGSQPFLASDSERFYIGLNHTPDAQASIQANFLNSSGIKSRLIDGELYALSRSNGKLAWRATCQQQAILLDNLDLTPTVILASRSNRPMPNNPNFRQTQVSIRSYDKRTGKLLFEKETPSQQPFTSVNIDTRKGTIDLVSPQNTISHQVTAEPVPAGPVLRDEALPAQPNGGNSR